jgi:hypothetical protein
MELVDTTPGATEPDYDFDAAADRVGAMLGDDYRAAPEKDTSPTETPGLQPRVTQPTAPAQTAPSAPVYEVPKSWKKEMHPHWEHVSPEAKAYIIEREKQLLDGFSSVRPIQEAISPYAEWLQRSNIRPEQAISSLFNAQLRLTNGPMEDRKAALRQLAEKLELSDILVPLNGQPNPQAAPGDPLVQEIQKDLLTVKQQMEAQQRAVFQAQYQENLKQIEAFAADTKAHPYFDEVGDQMVEYLRLRPNAPLQEVYERAVVMNPAVWAKEQARVLTEHEAKLKEKARLESLPKRHAKSVNIQSDRDGQEPTEPLGSIEDTIKQVHKQIRGRA